MGECPETRLSVVISVEGGAEWVTLAATRRESRHTDCFLNRWAPKSQAITPGDARAAC
jgi:hypothetical protein